MKYLLLYFSLLIFINVNAQSTNDSDAHKPLKKGITRSELEIAKAKYIQMMQSETYILRQKSMGIQAEKLNGVKPPVSEFKNSDANKKYTFNDIENIYKTWLAKNIQKTKFKSLDEGVDLVLKTLKLTQNMVNENAELYVLIKKANLAQIREIYAPEGQLAHDKVYEIASKRH